MTEIIRSREINSPQDYYAQPAVARAIFEYLGLDNPDTPSLLERSRLNTSKILNGVTTEYLSVQNLDIKNQKPNRAPSRSIKPWNLPEVIHNNPVTEMFQSTWQIDAPGSENIPFAERKPVRTLLLIDIEHFHQTLPGKAFTDQRGVFDLLEKTYEVMSKKLHKYDIAHLAVMTGKGYHFITQVPYTSEVMDELIEIGQNTEKSISERQNIVPEWSKRDRPVPPKAQQAHKGSALLGHYLVAQSIREIRGSSQIPVEVSDIGTEGVSIDLTPSLLRSVDTGGIGTAGSIYVKPLVNAGHYGPDIVRSSRLLTRIPREINSEERRNLDQLISVRQNFSKSAELLEETGGSIPDGSKGIHRLIKDYQSSRIKGLHDALDREPGDPPEYWENTYRNYAGIAGEDEGLAYSLANANPELLKPDVLNYVLNALYNKWGGNSNIDVAGHVRTFLRSAYEDPRFNWGPRFLRHYSAEQHATGWTGIILGQRFEED